MPLVALLFVAAVVLSGCSVLTGISPAYPADWSPRKSQPYACRDFAGRWESLGPASYARERGSAYLLFQLGLAEGINDLDELDRINPVRIACEGADVLVLQGFRGVVPVREKKLSLAKGEWSLSAHGLELAPISVSMAEGTGGYTGSRTLTLTLSEDGSLIGEEKWWTVGAALWVMPVGGSQTFWHYWSRR